MLHELLRRQGCKIEFHPSLPGATKQPDFKVRQPKSSEFIFEARTSMEIESGPDGGTRAYRIREFLRTIELQDHLIAIDELKEGSNDLSQRICASTSRPALRPVWRATLMIVSPSRCSRLRTAGASSSPYVPPPDTDRVPPH